MISKASSYLTSLLLREQIIVAEDRETYEYGFEITIANLVNGLIVLLIGAGFHRLPDAVLFYLVFVSLRFFCGGYHADSYLGCFLSFALTTALCLMISGLAVQYVKVAAGLSFMATMALWIYIFRMAPIEHENRQEPFVLHQGQVCSSGRNPSMKESKRAFDELFMRISLQNREFSLIIVYVGGA